MGRDIENDPFKTKAGGDVVIKSEQMPDNDFRLWVMAEVFNQFANSTQVVEVNEHGQALLSDPAHDSFEVFRTHPKAVPALVELESAGAPLVVETLEFEEVSTFSQGLAAVKSGGKWGYIDITGTMAVPPKFDGAEQFTDGLAAVRFEGRKCYIDRTGAWIWGPVSDR